MHSNIGQVSSVRFADVAIGNLGGNLRGHSWEYDEEGEAAVDTDSDGNAIVLEEYEPRLSIQIPGVPTHGTSQSAVTSRIWETNVNSEGL